MGPEAAAQDEITFMLQLAGAYRKFIGDGNEAQACERMAAKMQMQMDAGKAKTVKRQMQSDNKR